MNMKIESCFSFDPNPKDSPSNLAGEGYGTGRVEVHHRRLGMVTILGTACIIHCGIRGHDDPNLSRVSLGKCHFIPWVFMTHNQWNAMFRNKQHRPYHNCHSNHNNMSCIDWPRQLRGLVAAFCNCPATLIKYLLGRTNPSVPPSAQPNLVQTKLQMVL